MTAIEPSTRRDTSRYCGARKRQGEGFCQRPAGWGTDHPGMGQCKLHGGSTPSGRKAAEQRRVELEVGELLDKHRVRVEGQSHLDGLADAVVRLGSMVGALGELVGDLVVDANHDRDDAERTGPGLWGPDHHGDGRPNVLVVMYREFLTDYVRARKLAIDAGIDERQMRLAEAQGQLLAEVMRAVFGEMFGLLRVQAAGGVLDVDAVERLEREELPQVVRRHLLAVSDSQRPAIEASTA